MLSDVCLSVVCRVLAVGGRRMRLPLRASVAGLGSGHIVAAACLQLVIIAVLQETLLLQNAG